MPGLICLLLNRYENDICINSITQNYYWVGLAYSVVVNRETDDGLY